MTTQNKQTIHQNYAKNEKKKKNKKKKISTKILSIFPTLRTTVSF